MLGIGCTLASGVGAAPRGGRAEAGPDQAVAGAKAAVQKAVSVGFLSGSTDKRLKSAEEQAHKDDSTRAVSLTEAPRARTEEGYRQYQASRTAGPRF